MPFEIVRNDIVNMQVDAVVNTANPNPVIGSGVDSGIHKKLDMSCFWQDKKSAALLSVMHLLHQDSIWMLSMLSIPQDLFGRMAITEKSKFYLRVTGSHWHWLKSMSASPSHFP